MFFDDVKKEALRRVIWRMAGFSGIKVVTYCLMGNHFHLLARCRSGRHGCSGLKGQDSEAKLLEQLSTLYSRRHLRVKPLE